VLVFEGGQPGYAILVFDRDVESSSLRLAVRSMQVAQGAYLGPSGAFERAPHYFTAVRVVATKGGFGYQVGPEIVNHLMEDDQIEVSSEGGDLVETGYWANATPLMTGARGSIMMAGAAPAPLVSQAAARGGGAKTRPDGGGRAEVADGAEGKDETPSPKVAITPTPGPRDRRLGWALGGVALILAAGALALALALSPSLRCVVLSRDCASPPAPDLNPKPEAADEARAAQAARDCDALKTAAGLVCEEEAACFDPYRRAFPQGAARPELERRAGKAASACSAETEAYRQARDCAQAASACVAPTCYLDYSRKFADGAHAQKARDDIARAKALCPQPGPRPDDSRRPGPPPLRDGEYSAIAAEASACGIARQRQNVVVCSGRVRWVHEGRLFAGMTPVALQWEGTIDAAGEVAAGVNGNGQLAAKGRITETERAIAMRYPGCGETITLNITRKLSSGCPAGR